MGYSRHTLSSPTGTRSSHIGCTPRSSTEARSLLPHTSHVSISLRPLFIAENHAREGTAPTGSPSTRNCNSSLCRLESETFEDQFRFSNEVVDNREIEV